MLLSPSGLCCVECPESISWRGIRSSLSGLQESSVNIWQDLFLISVDEGYFYSSILLDPAIK